MKTTITLIASLLLLFSVSAQDTVQKSQAEAVRLYPALAQKDSPLTKAFESLYEQAKHTNPQLLTTPSWPLTFAHQAASFLGIAPQTQAPSVPSTPGKPKVFDIRIIQSVQSGVIANIMKAEAHGSGVADSMASIGGGGNVDIHVNYHPSGEPIFIQGFTGIKGKQVKIEIFLDGTFTYTDAKGTPTTIEKWIFIRTKTELHSSLDNHPHR